MSAATPPRSEPGFDLHADQRGRIVGTMAALSVITTASVALRFLSRKLSRAGLWWDDILCLLALIVSLAYPAILLYELRNGYGRHINIYSPSEKAEKAARYLKEFWFAALFFHTATTIAKFAVLAFYYRIFPVLQFRRLLLWVMGLCALYMIGVDAAVIFQCQPIHYDWDQVRTGTKGHCFQEVNFFIGSGSVNAILNLIIFILPIPLLRRLRTTTRQQIVLIALFTLAGFVVLVSVIWVIVVSKYDPMDVTWSTVDTGIWTALELSMAVVCACIPSLRPLWSVLSQSFAHPPLVRKTLSSSDGTPSSKRMWGSGMRQSNSNFSQLDESDDLRPLGHGVLVHGGNAYTNQGDEAAIEMPQNGITVKTEVTLEITDRLDYNDRLF